MELITYRHLADRETVPALVADYHTNFEKVAQYFSGNYREKDAWKRQFTRLQSRSYDRPTLHRVLNEQNREFQSGIKTLANIDLLSNDNTFAVVTGQQLGLFGGPLYTIYKAITAVKLAESLGAQYPDYNFVPVFWLEGEDHDIDEINKMSFISSSNALTAAEYLVGGKPLDRNIGATGSVVIDEHIASFFAAVEKDLPPTDYTASLLETMKGYYTPGTTLLKAFVGFFNHIYEDSGLVFVNANTPELKKVVAPLFVREINDTSAASKLVVQTSVELEEQYHAQIKAKALNLFLFYKGGRHLIEPSENGDYFLKNLRQRYTKEELLAIAQNTPELLSPNVVTRPLCQDTLFPTAAYVAGPGEISYFAQLGPVYAHFDIPMPIIYPRASITLVEEKVQKVLEKFSLEIEEFFGEPEDVLRKVSEQVSEVKVESLFSGLQQKMSEAVNEARFGIQAIDPTLNGTVDATIEKFRQQLEVLKQKTMKAQQQKEEISLKQIQKAAVNIFPGGDFQERSISVVYYLNKYGPDFVKWIANELTIDKVQHLVITL